MTAECNVTIGADITELGSELNKRVRFATTNTPEGLNSGYGTIAAANTYESLVLGQVAASTIDMCYIRSVDQTLYVNIASVAPAGNAAQLKIASGEANIFRPAVSTGVAVSVMIMSSVAGAKYEFLVVGQTS